MTASGEHPFQTKPRSESANDRFKRGWSACVAWCIVLATALHAAAFLAIPVWRRSATAGDLDRDVGLFAARLISLAELPGGPDGLSDEGGQQGGASAPLVAGADERDLPEGSTGAPGTPSLAVLWDRIARGGGIAPSVVAPELGPEPSAREAPDSAAAVDIRGRATATDGLSLVPVPDDMDLDRLSAVRPELALVDPSSWVLIRNSVAVDQFMRRTYDLGALLPGEEGLVSVAVWIDERGAVRWAEIDQSSGRSEMDEAALELFREVALFRPARDEGIPVARSAIFWVRFPWDGRLADNRPPRP